MAVVTDPYLARSAEIVDRCARIDREIAALEAEKADLLGERVQLLLDEVSPGAPAFDAAERSMFAEVSAGLRISRAAASRVLGVGWAMRDRFPQTRSALAAGDISLRHATVIVIAATPIGIHDRDALSAYEERVVPFAQQEVAARTEAFAKSVAAAVASETVVERHRRAREDRAVTVQDREDGMSLFQLLIPSVLAHAAFDRATALAKQTRMISAATACNGFEGPFAPQEGCELTDDDLRRLTGFETMAEGAGERLPDERTLDQVRADIVTDLLLAAATDRLIENGLDAVRGTVQVTIAATTLAGADDRLAELDGHGPIHPDIARALAGGAERWERLFLDPSGMIVCTDSYAPTERMKKQLRARDQRCRFPGCRLPARRCQIDHTLDHAKGGPTRLDNLSCLCEGHHVLKHPDNASRWRWSAVQKPGGVLEWTSPTGRVYVDTPTPRVQFV